MVIAEHIGLHEVGTILDQFKIGVAEQIFEGDHLAAMAQIFGGAGVANAVGMDVVHADATDQAAQGMPGERARVGVVNGE